ncbi:MAG: hypothetical protein UY09_C0024G0014 [Parcubacteria group bacterium GW2011_GWA2_47_8]|nr:MAG: hypothetical protein UY09_C0024G0014 [Parcubacteria group bacterium GW2011_GWA2_47_8]OHB18429.1 MAG: hypothetical protein A2666_05070 [Parcubacteria group bacterium RIFCSPHIGHO2_01_FULL_47_10b]
MSEKTFLTPEAQGLLHTLKTQAPAYAVAADEDMIKVEETVSATAVLFEKIRNAIDYQDEHLLRRSAIQRIMTRQMRAGKSAEKIAESLIRELIMARYLPNNAVPERRLFDVEKIVRKYILLLNEHDDIYPGNQNHIHRWVINLAANEVENLFSSRFFQRAIIGLMYSILREKITITNARLKPPRRDMLIFVGCHRALSRLDESRLRYDLFILYEEAWLTATNDDIRQIAKALPDLFDQIEGYMHDKIGTRVYAKLRKKAVPFKVLERAMLQNSQLIGGELGDFSALDSELRAVAQDEYKSIVRKTRSRLFRSTVFILITKVSLVFLVELPLERLFFAHGINWANAGINVLFPPFLMTLFGVRLRMPEAQNTARMIKLVHGIVYTDEPVNLRVKVRGGASAFHNVLMAVYYIIFIAVFMGIIWGLARLNFNIVSGALFVFFLTLVSFFGAKIRLAAREYLVLEERRGFLGFLFDAITLPIIQAGRWLSGQFANINIFIFLLDFVIEAPLKTVLEVLENWMKFVREKREEV